MGKKRRGLRKQLNAIQKDVERLTFRVKMLELQIEVERRKRAQPTWTWNPSWTLPQSPTSSNSSQIKVEYPKGTSVQDLMDAIDKSYRRLNNREDKDVDL
jgi:hypothetical protein